MTGGGGRIDANAKKQQEQWIPAPTDPGLVNAPCPICQERFETVWHDEAQEWVWMDAVRIKGRVYHSSCYEEASREGKARMGTPVTGGGTVAGARGSRTATPDSAVLGKRKAEVSILFL